MQSTMKQVEECIAKRNDTSYLNAEFSAPSGFFSSQLTNFSPHPGPPTARPFSNVQCLFCFPPDPQQAIYTTYMHSL